MIHKLVAKNLRANRHSLTTLILSNAIVYGTLFVLYSLTKNEYVLTRHQHLAKIMQFGALVASVIAVLFTLYGQRFMFQKRAREWSLYQVLGLEKKHLSKILRRESLIIFVMTFLLSTIAGYVFGVVSFLLLRKILGFNMAAFNIFKFYTGPLMITIAFLAFSFILNVGLTLYQIAQKTPTELIRYEKEAEKEPNVNRLFLMIGLITLGIGYYLALTIKNPNQSIIYMFIAILLVIIGTYCLFTSLSILYLKFKRNNKKYYYRKENFLSISNLLYRIKSNGMSLATITILCTAVIITISVSYTLGQGLKSTRLENDYELTYSLNQEDLSTEKIENIIRTIDAKLDLPIDRKYFVNYIALIDTTDKGEIILDLDAVKEGTNHRTFFTVTTKNYYEQAFGVILDDLKDHEIYYASSIKNLNQLEKITLDKTSYHVKPIEDKTNKTIPIDKTFIVTKDFDRFKTIVSMSSSAFNTDSSIASLNLRILVNEKEGQDLSDYLQAFADENAMYIVDQKEQWEVLQVFSGGFLFLGVLLSIVLTIITSLVLYYKQINEADQDRKRYLILKKLGVSDKLATRTIKRQMYSVFLSPVIVAVIHNFVASKIVSTMLKRLGVDSYWIYFKNLLIVSILFVWVYLIAYLLSQKAYKHIVWSDSQN